MANNGVGLDEGGNGAKRSLRSWGLRRWTSRWGRKVSYSGKKEGSEVGELDLRGMPTHRERQGGPCCHMADTEWK